MMYIEDEDSNSDNIKFINIDNIETELNLIKNSSPKKIGILCHDRRPRKINFSFLKDMPYLTYFRFVANLTEDSIIDPVYNLKNLVFLEWSEKNKIIEIQKFKKLKILAYLATPNVIIDDATSLVKLYLWKVSNLRFLPSLTNIQELILGDFYGTNLNGIENLKHLQSVTISRALKLNDLSALNICQHLDEIDISRVKKDLNYHLLTKCKSLTGIYLRSKIASCDFILDMPNLAAFTCREILDGNLNPIFESKNLEHVYIINHRKHYNRSRAEIVDRFGEIDVD